MKSTTILFAFVLAHAVAGQNVTCPGFYHAVGNGCYAFPEQMISWFDSSHICQFAGGYLANIESAQEQADLKLFYETYLLGSFYDIRWIGASDSVTVGEWRWVPSGTALSYSNWGAGFPNETLIYYNCAAWDCIRNTWFHTDCCSDANYIAPVCETDPL